MQIFEIVCKSALFEILLKLNVQSWYR